MMKEMIWKEDAVKALGEIHPLDHNGNAILNRIKKIPPIDATYFGYPVETIKLLTDLMRAERLSPERAVRATETLATAAEIIASNAKEITAKVMEMLVTRENP